MWGDVSEGSGDATQNGESPMTPSARMNALNIVGDLLRKVGVSQTFGALAPIFFSSSADHLVVEKEGLNSWALLD